MARIKWETTKITRTVRMDANQLRKRLGLDDEAVLSVLIPTDIAEDATSFPVDSFRVHRVVRTDTSEKVQVGTVDVSTLKKGATATTEATGEAGTWVPLGFLVIRSEK